MEQESLDACTLTPADVEALQRARRAIERVKLAICSGKRGEDWHEQLGSTFNALAVAETILTGVVLGQNREPVACAEFVRSWVDAQCVARTIAT